MTYVNIILLSISIICLLISLFILSKSVYVAVKRLVATRNKDIIFFETGSAMNDNALLNINKNECDLNRINITLVDFVSGKVIASIQSFPCIIGRGKDVDISIDSDSAISRRHVVFNYKNGCLFVSDLYSSNGTLMNGSKIEFACEVKNGDIMQIGRTQIELIVNTNL